MRSSPEILALGPKSVARAMDPHCGSGFLFLSAENCVQMWEHHDMRVSILTREYPPDIYGGAGVHVAQLVPQLKNLAEVEVHCMGEPREGATAHAENFPAGANTSLRVFGADLSMVAALNEPDIVHSHTWYANLAGMLGGIFFQIPHVVTAHSLEPLRPWKREQLGGGYELSSWAEKSAYESASAIIAVSPAMSDDILTAYPDLDPSKVHVVGNGVDTTEFYPDLAGDFLGELGVDHSRPVVVFVGRITKQKGLVHLLSAARQFDAGTQLVLFAGSPDTPEIEAAFTENLNLLRQERPGDVFWVQGMAKRHEVRQALTRADVFACPSIYEPLGIVNLEAMACETAVVASAVGGIPSVVVDGETGLLVAYDPTEITAFETDFAAKVNEMTRNPERAQNMGRAGRQRCIDEFSWEAIAAQTLDVYKTAQEYFQDHFSRARLD